MDQRPGEFLSYIRYMIYVYVYMGYQIIAYYIKYEDPEAHLEDYPP